MITYPCGTSSCILEKLPLTETIPQVAAAGIPNLEISTSVQNYFETFAFPQRAEEYAELAAKENLRLWSLHLPYSPGHDISIENDSARDEVIAINLKLIDAAHRAGIRTLVLHSSSEPIAPERRRVRMARSRDAILRHIERASAYGITIAVEELPRTCLGHSPEEMFELLDGTGAAVCFDTNHCLTMDTIPYLRSLHRGGLKIATVHFSDFDRVDERHRMPGDGVNDWSGILAALEDVNYAGALIYEVRQTPKDRPNQVNTPADIYANYQRMICGEL